MSLHVSALSIGRKLGIMCVNGFMKNLAVVSKGEAHSVQFRDLVNLHSHIGILVSPYSLVFTS